MNAVLAPGRKAHPLCDARLAEGYRTLQLGATARRPLAPGRCDERPARLGCARGARTRVHGVFRCCRWWLRRIGARAPGVEPTRGRVRHDRRGPRFVAGLGAEGDHSDDQSVFVAWRRSKPAHESGLWWAFAAAAAVIAIGGAIGGGRGDLVPLVGAAMWFSVCTGPLVWDLYEKDKASRKQCPDCCEEVKVGARVCRYCGYRWRDADGC
jgi:hypothetical protein